MHACSQPVVTNKVVHPVCKYISSLIWLFLTRRMEAGEAPRRLSSRTLKPKRRLGESDEEEEEGAAGPPPTSAKKTSRCDNRQPRYPPPTPSPEKTASALQHLTSFSTLEHLLPMYAVAHWYADRP